MTCQGHTKNSVKALRSRGIQKVMRLHLAFAMALLTCAAPAAAERLEFDYRLYPPLQQVLDAGNKEMVSFNADNPARLIDLIAVKGASAASWTEAMEIVSIARPRKIATAHEWMTIMQREAPSGCPATFAVLSEDANSITFERRAPACPADRAPYAIYRLVAGQRSWFELAVLAKDELGADARRQWLALLASAHTK